MSLFIMRPTSDGLDELINHFPNNSIMAEIGSYAGESAEIFLQSGKINKLYCIDPWVNDFDPDAVSSSCEPMENVEKAFDERLKGWNIVKLKMRSEEAVELFPDKFFDIIYIDALHTYEGCKADILNFLPKVKTIISGHDYKERWNGVIRAVNEVFGKPDVVFSDSSWLKKL